MCVHAAPSSRVWVEVLLFIFLNISFFLSFFWLRRVLVAAHRIFVSAWGIFSCSMWTLSYDMHAGSSSLTRDRTRAPCIGSVESYPLDHQGSSLPIFWLGCLFFWYTAGWIVCIFWRLIPCWSLRLQIFSPILWVVFQYFFLLARFKKRIQCPLISAIAE